MQDNKTDIEPCHTIHCTIQDQNALNTKICQMAKKFKLMPINKLAQNWQKGQCCAQPLS